MFTYEETINLYTYSFIVCGNDDNGTGYQDLHTFTIVIMYKSELSYQSVTV